MIIEDESIITDEEKEFIKSVILGGDIPFYWSPSQYPNDNKPFLYHTLIHRKTQRIHSEHAEFFKTIVKRFATKHKISCNVFIRGCINFYFPMEDNATPHQDHIFPYSHAIIYLNQSKGGATVILSDGIPTSIDNKILKTVEPVQFKILGFNGKYPHYPLYPKEGRRMIAVLTFI